MRSRSGVVLAISVVLVIALFFAALLREANPVPLSYIHAGSPAAGPLSNATRRGGFPSPILHYLVVGNASYTHPNPLRWAAFGEAEDEYHYALGGAVHGNQHTLKRFATTAMPREIEAKLELEVYGAPAHYDARVRSNEPGYTSRLDWLRMSTPRGCTTGSTEALRVFSFARVLDWIPASMWAKRWTQLCVFEAIWQLSRGGNGAVIGAKTASPKTASPTPIIDAYAPAPCLLCSPKWHTVVSVWETSTQSVTS